MGNSETINRIDISVKTDEIRVVSSLLRVNNGTLEQTLILLIQTFVLVGSSVAIERSNKEDEAIFRNITSLAPSPRVSKDHGFIRIKEDKFA